MAIGSTIRLCRHHPQERRRSRADSFTGRALRDGEGYVERRRLTRTEARPPTRRAKAKPKVGRIDSQQHDLLILGVNGEPSKPNAAIDAVSGLGPYRSAPLHTAAQHRGPYSRCRTTLLPLQSLTPTDLPTRINSFAERAEMGRTTVYAEIRAGKLKAKRRGSRTIITAAAARAYSKACRACRRRRLK